MRLAPVLMAFLAGLLLVMTGCGGGGGGGGTTGGGQFTVTGIVQWLATSGPPDPVATVQIGTNTTTTNAVDGSFVLSGPAGASTITVTYRRASDPAPIVFTYAIDPLSANIDVGNLIIGAEQITLTGVVRSAKDSSSVAGAIVQLAGRRTTTAADGTFVLAGVPYDPAAPGALVGLPGLVTATGFVNKTFFADTGTTDLGEILLSIESGSDPPDLPYNIEGDLSPAADAVGATVTLIQNGSPVRQVVVGASRHYGFFVPAGTYTIQIQNLTTGKSAADKTVTLATVDQVQRYNATLQ